VAEIRSPIPGIFYRRPSPDEDEFVQEGDTVCVGRPTPIECGMTDVRIAEIDQADKIECIWLYKGMDRPGVRVQRHQLY